MSFLHHSSRGRQAVDEQTGDDEPLADDGAGAPTATGAPDGALADGQGAERPRYAFGYASDDASGDDGTDGRRVRGDAVPGDENTDGSMDRGDVVRGDVVREDRNGGYPDGTPADETMMTPVLSPQAGGERDAVAPATVAPEGATPGGAGTAAGLDGPLLADPAGLRARWQQAQADFVDDPRAAVSDAAALVEETAQAIIDGLAQRQRQLRQRWERDQAGDPNAPAGEPSDTERLRLTMRQYRMLFDQLCAR